MPTTYWYEGVSSGDFLVNFVTTIANDDDPSQVYSIGYGAYEYALSQQTRSTFDTEAQKAALRGITFISAAGNDGVAGECPPHMTDLPLNISLCPLMLRYPSHSFIREGE